MADVSYLQDDDDDVSPHISHGSHLDLLDLDIPSSQDFFCRPDPEHQANLVIDMFRQPQLHSVSPVIQETDLVRFDPCFGVVEGNEDVDSHDFEVDFGSELGFPLGNHNRNDGEDDDCGFVVADSGDDFFVSRRTRDRHAARSESGDSTYRSGARGIVMNALRVADIGSDSDDAGENDIVEVEDDSCVDGGCDDGASLQLCWDAFRLEDDNITADADVNANADFEWEEVDGQIDEREAFSMFFGAEADDDASVLPGISPGGEELGEDRDALEWEVLLHAHHFEPNPDLAGQYDEYNYTEYEMFFGQFADNDVLSVGRPPASKTVVENLLSLVMTQEDFEKNNTLCAVCKDEIGVGEMAKQLPCSHRYHGDCIVPWLGMRNTCPVCRHELQTDDPDYECRKVETVAHPH